jgi:hypothetical protein
MNDDHWKIGQVGGLVLIQAVKRGQVIYQAQFTPEAVLVVVDQIVRQVQLLRPPPSPTTLRRVK